MDPEPAHPRDRSSRTALDRLYERLIRDLFGRAVPGLLLLLALAVSISSFGDVAPALERATFWMWLGAAGAGWLTAFGLLEVGRRFNLALLSPEAITDEQYWAAEERFRSNASRRQRAEYDRMVTVRDSMAVSSVSLLLTLLVLGVDFILTADLQSQWTEIRNLATAVVVLAGLAIALQLAHRVYVRRTWRFLADAAGERP